MADGTLAGGVAGVVGRRRRSFDEPLGAVHAEELVAARHQGGHRFAVAAHDALALQRAASAGITAGTDGRRGRRRRPRRRRVAASDARVRVAAAAAVAVAGRAVARRLRRGGHAQHRRRRLAVHLEGGRQRAQRRADGRQRVRADAPRRRVVGQRRRVSAGAADDRAVRRRRRREAETVAAPRRQSVVGGPDVGLDQRLAHGRRVRAAEADAFVRVVETRQQTAAQRLQFAVERNLRVGGVAGSGASGGGVGGGGVGRGGGVVQRRGAQAKVITQKVGQRRAGQRRAENAADVADRRRRRLDGRAQRRRRLVQRRHHVRVADGAQKTQAEAVDGVQCQTVVHGRARLLQLLQAVGRSGAVDAQQSGAQGDVGLDLALCLIHVVRHARHLEDGLLLPRGRHDVRRRLLLDALDGGALGTHHQADHAVRNAHLPHTHKTPFQFPPVIVIIIRRCLITVMATLYQSAYVVPVDALIAICTV